MTGLFDRLLRQSRAVLTLAAVMALVGLYFWATIPRESAPDIDLPVFSITVAQEGISADDAERLLARPIENALRGIEGLREVTVTARAGRASVVAEFGLSTDRRDAFATLREKLTLARTQLPDAAEEPVIEASNSDLPPAMTVALSGDVPERTLQQFAKRLKERIEILPDILRADLAGSRAELIEVIVDQARLQSYGITEADLAAAAARNNRLVTAGGVGSGADRLSIKVPGLFSSEDDILSLPIRSVAGSVITLRDIAQVRRTFKEAASNSRVNGRPAVVLQIVKAPGANIVDTNRAIQEVVAEFTREWPPTIRVDVVLDQARLVPETLRSMQSTLVTATLLVMLVMAFTLGVRSALLVGVAIPLSFLSGFMALGFLGVTMNRIVIFALILTIGMVVDGVIVLVEYAQRAQARGLGRADAYRLAAKQVFWPVVSSTATSIAVFFPLLFWPGAAGKLMSALPITAIAVLTASLFVALVVLPIVGGGSRAAGPGANPWRGAIGPSPLSLPILEAQRQIADGRALVPVKRSAATGTPRPHLAGPLSSVTLWYLRLLDWALPRPTVVLAGTLGLFILVLAAFRLFGQGVEFFVSSEPEEAVLQVFGRGDLSAREELDLVRSVEAEIRQMEGIRTVLAISGRSGIEAAAGGDAYGPVRRDLIGQITVEFMDYNERPAGKLLLQELRKRTATVPGIQVEVRQRETGLPVGKPVRLQISSSNRETAMVAAAVVRQRLDSDRQLRDVEDSRPLPAIDWVLKVDREEASRYRADIASIGATIQMVTNGLLLGKYRPVDSDDEIEIRARFPSIDRTLGQLDHLSVRTPGGIVPISNLVEREPQPQAGERLRKDRRYVVTVAADVADGVLASAKIQELKGWLQSQQWQPDTTFRFRGTSEDQKQASDFLKMAMLVALFLIFVILVAVLDNFFQTAAILFAVVLSITGVMIGMMVTRQPFSVIMTGTGILALAGVVVNNSIMLIDRANQYSRIGMPTVAALRRTCAERARPVMLTAIATVVALAPSALQVNFNIFGPSIEFGSITSTWWVQFSTALIFGISFAALLTLIVVPTMLAAPTVLRERWRQYEAERIANYVKDRNAVRQPRLVKRS
jgi:multidrug efflux pump